MTPRQQTPPRTMAGLTHARAWLRPRVLTIVLAGFALDGAALAAAAAEPAAPAPTAAEIAPFDLGDETRISAGRRRFNKNCAGYCHGHEGVGGRAPDFRGRSDLPAEQAFHTITNGRRGADIMPPWGNAYSAEQIWELVAYLMHLGKQQ